MRPPWCPVTTRQVAQSCGTEPGLWNVWAWRGLTPSPLPAAWFRGRSRIYRVDDVLAWIAERTNTSFDRASVWRDYLSVHYGLETTDDQETTNWIQKLVEYAGEREFLQFGIRFTRSGWLAFLESFMNVEKGAA